MTVIQIYLRNMEDRRSTARKTWQKLHGVDEMLFFAWFNVMSQQAPSGANDWLTVELQSERVRAESNGRAEVHYWTWGPQHRT